MRDHSQSFYDYMNNRQQAILSKVSPGLSSRLPAQREFVSRAETLASNYTKTTPACESDPFAEMRMFNHIMTGVVSLPEDQHRIDELVAVRQ